MHESEEVTVLLIEDNQVDVMGVQRAFKNFPNPMIVANDGLDALEKLRGENVVKRPYIVLLDLNMPRMNGVEFLEEIRDDHDLKNSIVFVLTTSNAPDDRQQVFDHHVAGYIVKGKTGGGFMDAASLLNRYAQICEIP